MLAKISVKLAIIGLLLVFFVFMLGCVFPKTDWGVVEEALELAEVSTEKAVEKCEESPSDYSKYKCLSEIAEKIAPTALDDAIAICETLPPLYILDRTRDKCFFSVALHMSQADIEQVLAVCSRISDLSYKQADACYLMAGSLSNN